MSFTTCASVEVDQVDSLNVLVIGKFYTEGFGRHIAETLEAMKHKVVRFESGPSHDIEGNVLAKRWFQARAKVHELSKQFPLVQRRLTRRLLRAVENENIDLTIICHDFLLPAEVRSLKAKTKSPVVMWFPDHIGNFQRSFFLNADYDALFFKDPFIVYRLAETLSRPVYYLPECCNPLYHKPCELSGRDRELYGCEITTAGNLYSYRVAVFSQLKGYEVKIWGNPPPLWMDIHLIEPMLQKKFVANEEKSKAFRAAKICVNNLYPAEVWGINARAFEIAGAGGFQMIEWRPGIEQLFRNGEELVSFTSMADLKDKIEYYLPREDERQRIAQNGQQRAHLEHTYEKRLELLLSTVFNRANGYPMPEISYTMQQEFESV